MNTRNEEWDEEIERGYEKSYEDELKEADNARRHREWESDNRRPY
jgi:hypothetical protein